RRTSFGIRPDLPDRLGIRYPSCGDPFAQSRSARTKGEPDGTEGATGQARDPGSPGRPAVPLPAGATVRGAGLDPPPRLPRGGAGTVGERTVAARAHGQEPPR